MSAAHPAPAADPARARFRIGAPTLVFAAWSAIVLGLASRHAVWRDEVRAFSLATDPATLADMVRALHGEGHPALWYLILRAGHGLFGTPLVLPAAAAIAAAAGIWWWLHRAPLPLLTRALFAFSGFALVEYPVVARNYGISLLPLFLFATLYDRRRGSGLVLGLILAILANTNVHSALLAACCLALWLWDTLREFGLRRSRALGWWAANAVLVAAAIGAAFLVVHGPANDAVSALVKPLSVEAVMHAVLDPGAQFAALAPVDTPSWLLSLLLFASLAVLAGSLGAALAGLGALWAFSLLFALVYPGFYRHQALWVVFLAALAALVAARRPAATPPPRWRGLREAGRLAFTLLLVIQVALAIITVAAGTSRPWSNSRAVAEAIAADDRLGRRAIVMADPDFMAEALPFYGISRTYLAREGRFGHVVNFTRQARTDLTLGQFLADAERLRAEHGAPVAILLKQPLDPAGWRVREGYNWVFSATPDEAARFRDATEMLGAFRGSLMGEDYDLYRLR